jgi:hypothetical protein
VNSLLATAATLAILTAGAHSYLGERYILIRLFRRTDLPKLFGVAEFTKRTLRFAWHLTSIAWLGFAALLVVLGRDGGGTFQELSWVICGAFGLSGLVALVGSRGRHVSWVVFVSIAVLVWVGSR